MKKILLTCLCLGGIGYSVTNLNIAEKPIVVTPSVFNKESLASVTTNVIPMNGDNPSTIINLGDISVSEDTNNQTDRSNGQLNLKHMIENSLKNYQMTKEMPTISQKENSNSSHQTHSSKSNIKSINQKEVPIISTVELSSLAYADTSIEEGGESIGSTPAKLPPSAYADISIEEGDKSIGSTVAKLPPSAYADTSIEEGGKSIGSTVAKLPPSADADTSIEEGGKSIGSTAAKLPPSAYADSLCLQF